MRGAVFANIVDATQAAAVRARWQDYARYALLDRGHYEYRDGVDEPALARRLTLLASDHLGITLAAESARLLRFRAGDYALAHHDRELPSDVFELALDVSAQPVRSALHYRHHGKLFCHVAAAPGTLSIVQRGPGITCSHSYISKLTPDAEVVRLMLLARRASD